MPIQVAATANANGTFGSSVSVAIACSAGDVLQVFPTNDTSGAVTLSSVTDGTNAYSQLGTTINDTVNDQEIGQFVTGPLAAGGTLTIQANYSGGAGGLGIFVKRITGSTGWQSPLQHGQVQAAPTTGANDVTTGSMGTLTAQPALLSGISVCTANGSDNPTVGTGFSEDSIATGGVAPFAGGVGGGTSESQRVTTLVSGAACTFTAVANLGHVTLGAVFTEASSGNLAGTAAITFGASATLTGAGALAGTTAITFGANGTLSATGLLAGSTAITFGASGVLAAIGALAGTPAAITFGLTGTLINATAGAISGSCSITFGLTGTLTPPAPPVTTPAYNGGGGGGRVGVGSNIALDDPAWTPAQRRKFKALERAMERRRIKAPKAEKPAPIPKVAAPIAQVHDAEPIAPIPEVAAAAPLELQSLPARTEDDDEEALLHLLL
jgi:hypothetical protein